MNCKKMRKLIVSVLFLCVSTFCMAGSASAYVLGPTTPGKWGNPTMGTSGGTVTWSLLTTGSFYTALEDFMPAAYHTEIEAAFDAWSAVADITFVEIPDSGLGWNAPGATGDIRIGGHDFDGPGGTLAHGYFPPDNGLSAAGDIHFDDDELWKIGFGGGGFDIFQIATHEIGHAIGLSHTGVPNSLMNPYYTEAFSGLQADDIDGIVALYGANTTEPVPEPCTITLLGIGIIGMFGYGWRRRKQSSKENSS